jgi:hypothetical protein
MTTKKMLTDDGEEWPTKSSQSAVSNKAIEKTLSQRGDRYGKFSSHAEISQNIKEAMGAPGWGNLTASQREALEMVAHKAARIINGDSNYIDSWRDIAAYVQLVIDELMVTPGASDSRVETVYFCDNGWSK